MSVTVDVEQITARAVQIKPARVVMVVVAAPFLLLGLVLRMLWLLPAFLISSGLEGWRAADELVRRWRAQARDQASRGGLA